ncbi:MAG: HEAT repeat domain-containing protein [Candidatus Omnitrophica bacterium]|nr:HEAT repeat domain-containing protein [Candidatus Omnitrophota bacterium]MDD5518408.1 HEAT repeat domain-containing protein [Candidatus Omnitrophota bacterium]
MYNYHTDLIWIVDKILLYLVILTGLLTIFYSLAKEYRWKRRSRALLNIKKNIYELALSGKKTDNNVCLSAVSGITPQQFLDATTNRNREVAFFNESEQKILKSCFISSEKLSGIERTAVSSWSKWRRIEAILTLGYAQGPLSVNTLKKTISDKDFDIAYFSIIALGQIKSVLSARILLDFVKKRSLYHYRIFSLLESFPPGVADEVIGLTSSPDQEVRGWAVKLICRLKALQYCQRIEELTRDKSAEVRASACVCLGEFGRKGSAGAIVKCLTDDFWMVRASAVKALFKVLGKEGLPEIMARINDGSLSVIESVKALMAGNIEICLPYVEDFLYGEDEMARRTSVEALEASGYIIKLFRDILTGREKDKDAAMYLLKGLIVSCAYAGLEVSLLNFSLDERRRILDIIRDIDEPTAGILEKNIAGHKG